MKPSIGLFTSLLPGQSAKTQSEEFKEAVAKEKLRKRLVNVAGRGDEKKLAALLALQKTSAISLNDKINDVTPLMAAAANGKLNAVKMLLDAGADPCVQDRRGQMALEHARKGKHKDVAEYLLNNMGDKNIFNILKSLGFARYWEPFVTSQVTMEQFKKLTDADYDRMGLPIGPRKQIQRHLKELEEKANPQPHIPRSASDALPSPRGGKARGVPSGSAARSSPDSMDMRAISADQISDRNLSPRGKKPGTPPPLHLSTPVTVGAAGHLSNDDMSALSPYQQTTSSLGSSQPTPATSSLSPRRTSPHSTSPKSPKKSQYVEYDKFDQEIAAKSPSRRPKKTKATAEVEANDRKLLGQYVDYQKTDFESEASKTGDNKTKKKATSPMPSSKKKENEDNNYIYGGVGNLTSDQKGESSKPNYTATTTQSDSDDDSSSDEDSESDSGEDISSDEGPGDERKYGYREIDYEELVFGKKIGAGAFGAVFKGTWRGAPVAIKKLKNFDYKNKQMVEEFRREAKLAELVHNHPNVVKFVGACSKQKGRFCLVTMFCSGGSLDKILRDHSIKISLQTTVRMAVEAASGIYHLHCEGVIHRDIAARNCLVGENFHIFVTDFGFARIKDNATTEYARTVNAVGPVKHMSPEAMREKKYSEKSDTFSFGVLLWEMFTREEPYAGEKDLVKLAFRIAVQGHRLTIPSSVPAPITQLMKDCWETDPHKRPNFKEILKRLSTYENTLEEGDD